MLSIEGVNVADAIVRHFADIGYCCTYALVNARWFGTPQDRRRLIFIATRRELGTTVPMLQASSSMQQSSVAAVLVSDLELPCATRSVICRRSSVEARRIRFLTVLHRDGRRDMRH